MNIYIYIYSHYPHIFSFLDKLGKFVIEKTIILWFVERILL